MATKGSFRPKLKQGLAVGLVSAFLVFVFWSLNWLDSWEFKTWDWRAGLLADPGPATDDIRLILLDQKSLDWAEKENGLTWPWPRELYGHIVNYCKRSGARALAFDVMFTEFSKWGVPDDAAFGKAIKNFGRFAGTVFLGHSSGKTNHWPHSIPHSRIEIKGLSDWLRDVKTENLIFSEATFPIPDLAQNAETLCNVNLTPDTDGIYRRIKLFGIFDDYALPSLGIGTYLATHQNENVMLRSGHLIFGDRSIPIDKEGNTILRFRGPSGTHRAYSAAAVLQSEIRMLNGEKPTIKDENAFKNKYVFFGFTAPGLYDLRSSPVGGVYPGVEIHATLLDNFLSEDFIRQAPSWFVIILILFLALASGVLVSYFSGLKGTIIIGGVFLCIPIFISLLAYKYGYWLPLVAQESTVLISILLAFRTNYATEGRQKRFIKNAFKQYLSPVVIDQLLQNPERLKLGGERKIISIFFSDLQGFTSISEDLDPETLTNLLNDYLSEMTEIIQTEGGTVDKYEGDAIIAFWNAPLEVPDHAIKVVRAALNCQAKLGELRPIFKKKINKDMYMRIGINTGPAVVGNMGSYTRFDYTMMGDAVNLASRLEELNKQFGTFTMISEYTHQLTGDAFSVRELGRVAVVGRRKLVKVYEPMLIDEYIFRKETLDEFSKGLDHFYNRQFQKAQEIFISIQDEDPPAAAYVKKCLEIKADNQENRTGTWVMTKI